MGDESAGADFFLSSLESRVLAPVRSCEVTGTLAFDTGKRALECTIVPPVVGQLVGQVPDLDRVVLVPRHAGGEVDPVSEWPLFVFVCRPRDGVVLSTPLRRDDLVVLGWGEIYRTSDDAEQHRFG